MDELIAKLQALSGAEKQELVDAFVSEQGPIPRDQSNQPLFTPEIFFANQVFSYLKNVRAGQLVKGLEVQRRAIYADLETKFGKVQ